jgi:hypothetical protein
MNKKAFEIGFEAGYNDMMKEAGFKDIAGKAKKVVGDITSGITGSRYNKMQHKKDFLYDAGHRQGWKSQGADQLVGQSRDYGMTLVSPTPTGKPMGPDEVINHYSKVRDRADRNARKIYDKAESISKDQVAERSRITKTRLGAGAIGTTGLGAYALTRKKDGE